MKPRVSSKASRSNSTACTAFSINLIKRWKMLGTQRQALRRDSARSAEAWGKIGLSVRAPHFQAIVSNSLGVYGARPTSERGLTMRRFLSVVVLTFFALAPSAHADSILNINITYVTAFMSPNNGSGDNISFTLIGPGTTITGIAGMACFSWCNGPIPDLDSVATSQVFISNFLS